MPKYKKIILSVLLAFTLLSIAFVNLRSTLLSYHSFYQTKEAADSNRLYTGLSFVENLRPYSLFLTYSGLETGYGFFAPNVASDFVVEFECLDSTGKVLKENASLLMRSKEGGLRLNTATSMFMYYIKPDSLSTDGEKCKIFLKGLSLRMMEREKNISSVTARVFLYHYPDLVTYNIDKKPVYVLYESQSYTRNNIGAW
jgi:hypothetical protein